MTEHLSSASGTKTGRPRVRRRIGRSGCGSVGAAGSRAVGNSAWSVACWATYTKTLEPDAGLTLRRRRPPSRYALWRDSTPRFTKAADLSASMVHQAMPRAVRGCGVQIAVEPAMELPLRRPGIRGRRLPPQLLHHVADRPKHRLGDSRRACERQANKEVVLTAGGHARTTRETARYRQLADRPGLVSAEQLGKVAGVGQSAS